MANESQKERLKILGEIGNLTKKINAFNKEGIEDEKRANELNKERLKLADKLREVNQKIRDEQRSSYVDAQNGIKSMASLYEPLKEAERQRIDMQLKGADLSKVALDRSNRLATINQQIANLTGDQTLEKQILQDEYTSEIAKLEKNKGITSDIIDNLNAQNDMAQSYAGMTERQKQAAQRHRDVLDGIHDTVSGTLETFRLLTSTVGGVLGSALIGAGFALNKLGHAAHELGTFFTESTMSAAGLGLVFKDATATAKGLSSELGGIENATFEAQAKTNLLAHNLNMGGEQAAKMVGAFARLNENSTETALNLAASTKQFAIQQGVIPAQVMEDVANSTEAFALYGKEGGKNIGQAAVMAAKLGVNMNTITGVTDSLLDFESSITKELELGAMLGRNINFNKARQLAYDGKLGASVKETVRQLGGIEAFNKMDVFQKRQAAEAAGMSVEQFQKMAANLDNINDKGEIQLSQFDSMKESLKAVATGPLGDWVKGFGSVAIAAGQMGVDVKAMAGQIPGIGKLFNKLPSKGAGGIAGAASGAAGDAAGSMTDQLNNTTQRTGGMNVMNMVKGAAAILILSAALFVAAKAFQEFGSVTWESVGMGLTGLAGMAAIAFVLGQAAGPMLQGSLAVAALGLALVPFALSMQMLSGIGIDQFATTAGGLILISGAASLLGFALPFITAGAIALGALGIGLLTFGAGALVAGKGIESFGKLPEMLNSFSSIDTSVLTSMILPLMGLSVSLAMMAPSLMLFGAGAIIAGTGLKLLGEGASVISSMSEDVMNMVSVAGPMSSMIPVIAGLAGAFSLLGASLGILGTVGLPGLAVLAGVAALSEPLARLASVLGLGGEEGTVEATAIEDGSLSEYQSQMLQKMDVLIQTTAANRDVYLDKDKVTNLVIERGEKMTGNVFGLGVA